MPRFTAMQKSAKKTEKTDDKIRRMVRNIALAISMIVWFAVPYIAVDILTFYQQPSVFQMVTNQVLYWSSVFESIKLHMCWL